jgi:hypothetical protein
VLYREPEFVPHLPGVFALVNRKRRYAYISFTTNLQKRSHSLSHMLVRRDEDPNTYWPIRDLPKHPSDEHVFMVMKSKDITEANALAAVAAVERQFAQRGYKLIEGNRAASPTITLNGKKMTLAEAVSGHSKAKYLTVYRRLERGWTVEEALGLVPPAPRWHIGKQAERKAREAKRAA